MTRRLPPRLVAGAAGALVLLTLGACGTTPEQAVSTSESTGAFQTLEPGILKVCLYPGFAPFAIKDDQGSWSGWDVDFLDGFAAQHGLTLQPVDIAQFNDIWMRPGNNECDIAGTGITQTQDRLDQTGDTIAWSDTYYSVARGLAVKKGTRVTSIDDLAGKTVTTTRGSTADIDLQARLAQAGITTTTVEYVDGGETGAGRVADGAAIAFAEGVGSIETLIEQFADLELAWPHCLMLPGGTISSEPFSFAVRPGSSGAVTALNAYIANPSVPYPGGLGSGRDCPTGQ